MNIAPFWPCCHGNYTAVITKCSSDTSKALWIVYPLHATQLGSTSFTLYSGLHMHAQCSDLWVYLRPQVMILTLPQKHPGPWNSHGNMSAMHSCPAFAFQAWGVPSPLCEQCTLLAMLSKFSWDITKAL